MEAIAGVGSEGSRDGTGTADAWTRQALPAPAGPTVAAVAERGLHEWIGQVDKFLHSQA